MLKSLKVWNFALLEEVQVDFGPGLNILTGETGAGKSILIDSLGAILGQRLSSDSIRTGADWLRIEAVFEFEQNMALNRFLTEQAIVADDAELIITRQLTRGGRGSVLVNGCHVTLTILKELGKLLVDIHGQNENLALLKEVNHFALLDGSSPLIETALTAYQEIFAAWSDKKKLLAEKEAAAREYAQRLDMLRWQDREIDEARLKEREDEQLETDIRRLSHAEKISADAQEAYRLLSGSRSEGILPQLAQVIKNLTDIERFDEGLENSLKMVREAQITLQEAASEIRSYGEDLDFSPQKLDELQKRMDVIYRMRKKYGATIEDVLAYQTKIRQELAVIENYDEDVAKLKADIAASAAKLAENAQKLTRERQKGAAKLSEAILGELTALGMPKARFAIELSPLKDYGPKGQDDLTMNFSANPGEEPKPLQKIASGGELSRIALAIKSVAAAKGDGVGSMVFDEIDTGIGGRTAQMVAERIAAVARHQQVLCITHLPQIACMADEHLYIAKSEQEGKTITRIRSLGEAERLNEIARMASGDTTLASLDNAREMVAHAKVFKSKK